MEGFNKTISYSGAVNRAGTSLVTIFDGNAAPRTIHLGSFGKGIITFGRDPRNDISLSSRLVSSQHGRFIFKGHGWVMEDKGAYDRYGSTNGLIYNLPLLIS